MCEGGGQGWMDEWDCEGGFENSLTLVYGGI